MLTRITRVGSSVGIIIPRYIAAEGGFHKGAPVNIEYSDNAITITKEAAVRKGWAEAFAAYAREGEDAQALPDFMDSEAMELAD